MEIIKYFYEEPASLETLSPDLDPDARRRTVPEQPWDAWSDVPRYHRGYVAGTDLGTGRVGLTALPHRDAFITPLLDALGSVAWMHHAASGTVEPLGEDAARQILRDPQATTALVCADAPLPEGEVAALAGAARRYALPAVLRLLETPSCVVFFPEPAHHGHDWSFFAARPLRDRLVEAFRRHPEAGARRFAVPFRKARSEHTFYFDTYALEAFAAYEIV